MLSRKHKKTYAQKETHRSKNTHRKWEVKKHRACKQHKDDWKDLDITLQIDNPSWLQKCWVAWLIEPMKASCINERFILEGTKKVRERNFNQLQTSSNRLQDSNFKTLLKSLFPNLSLVIDY